MSLTTCGHCGSTFPKLSPNCTYCGERNASQTIPAMRTTVEGQLTRSTWTFLVAMAVLILLAIIGLLVGRR